MTSNSLPIEKIGPFIVKQKLGSGAFSSVYLCVHEETGLQVAIKDIQISASIDSSVKTHLVREINMVKSAQSNFIAQLYDVIETKDHVYLVLEYVENGNIFQSTSKVGLLSGEHARITFAQLTVILNYLHNQLHIAHRDIKAENVLVDKYWNIKLVDFGLCNHFTTQEQHFRSVCGSIQYLAPEIVKNKPYTRAVDIWSAGVLIYLLVIGRFPFEDISMQLLVNKIASTAPLFPQSADPKLVDLLTKMLCKDPKLRITAEQMKTHPYFKGIDFDQLSSSPSDVNETDILNLAASKNLDYKIVTKEMNNNIIYKILKKEVQNSKVKRTQAPPKETEKKPISDKKKFIFLDSKKPDPMKVLAKRFAHGKVTPRARVTMSDVNLSDAHQTRIPKTKSEMST